MQEAFLNTVFRGYLWELIAAVAGAYYLLKVSDPPFINKVFVWFIWFTLFIDVAGFYALAAYYSGYEWFGFVKGTNYAQNYWMYNAFKLLSFVVYLSVFTTQINSSRIRKLLWGTIGVFSIVSISNFIFSGQYFKAYMAFTVVGGTILLLIYIGIYFYQILKSNRILNFYKELSFYIAIGALLWHLSITPLFIFNKYVIMSSSPDFVQIYLKILTLMNFLMYGIFSFGFIILSKKERQISKSGI